MSQLKRKGSHTQTSPTHRERQTRGGERKITENMREREEILQILTHPKHKHFTVKAHVSGNVCVCMYILTIAPQSSNVAAACAAAMTVSDLGAKSNITRLQEDFRK